MHVSVVAGARPNFMKIAPIARALRAADLPVRIIHSGQHYDRKMSQTFFEELEIPEPDVNLAVGSGTHVFQISEVMQRLEAEFNAHRPDALVVVGDVNSTMAAALTACKMEIPVAHVEAGLRSYDRGMPEEINRVVTDSVCDWLFTSEPSANQNLQREGVPAERIFHVGNVMIDTLFACLDRARALQMPQQLGLRQRGYAVLTLHRPSNVDDPERLASILRAVHRLSRDMPVVFPIHPRTQSRIEQFGMAGAAELNGYRGIESQGYLNMLGLVDSARLVLTDSGGLQEETTALRVPCLTLRENTERPATIDAGSNRLVGWKTDAVTAAIDQILAEPERIGTPPANWDGNAAERITTILHKALHWGDPPTSGADRGEIRPGRRQPTSTNASLT